MGDVENRPFPAHCVHGLEFEADVPVIVHIDEIDAPRARLVGMPPLGVAGVDYGRRMFAERLAGMHVSERPVVYARPFKIVQRAWGVEGVIRVAADVGVHESYGERAGIDRADAEGQVVVDVARRVADAVHDGAFGLGLEHGHGLEHRAEAGTAWRIVQPRLPAVQRIVVAMADERADARLVQPVQPIDELELRAQAPIRRIVHVARHEQRVHPLVDAQLDDVLIGRERGVVERVRHVVGSRRLQAGERAVQV